MGAQAGVRSGQLGVQAWGAVGSQARGRAAGARQGPAAGAGARGARGAGLAGSAAWARGLTLGCALGALGLFLARFDSVFS